MIAMQDIIFHYDDGTEARIDAELATERGLHDCRHHTIGPDGPHCVDDRGLLPAGHSVGANATTEPITSPLLETDAPMGGETFPLLLGALALVVVGVVFLQSRKPAPLAKTNHEQPRKV